VGPVVRALEDLRFQDLEVGGRRRLLGRHFLLGLVALGPSGPSGLRLLVPTGGHSEASRSSLARRRSTTKLSAPSTAASRLSLRRRFVGVSLMSLRPAVGPGTSYGISARERRSNR